jgi:hypothetical protein
LKWIRGRGEGREMKGRFSFVNVVGEGVWSDTHSQVLGALIIRLLLSPHRHIIERTYDLGNSLGSTFSILLTRFGSCSRVTGNTKDSWHLSFVEVWHQWSEKELGVGSITSWVGNSFR